MDYMVLGLMFFTQIKKELVFSFLFIKLLYTRTLFLRIYLFILERQSGHK